MAFDRTGRLVVGTPDGVFRLDGAAWSPLGLRGQPVAAMAFDARGNLYVGTRGAGLWLVSASDGAWTIVPVGASNDVRAIAFDRTGAIQVGTGDAAILTATDGLTRLPWPRDALFSLSLARQSDLDLGVLSDAVRADFADQGVTLASAASIVVVQSGRVWLLRDDQDVAYLIRRGASELSVSSSPALAVLGMPRPFPGQPTWRTWTLRNEAGWEGTIAASADDLFQDGAGPADPSIGEIARILASEVSANQEYTTLTLAAPLRESYDPSTTTLSANVAPATHGETVPQEVLGSGNASRANQHFTLKKPPLTYVPAATPSGSADTLTIRVQPTVTRPLVPVPGVIETAALTDGIFWREVPSLYTAGPRDRVYMVRFDDEGRPTVTFGDGERGARLPTGTENVVATYRSGLGPTGNLDANRLTTPRSRPPGVRKVTNPVPATGGELPEGMDEARTRAPLTIRTFGRIVSLRDYEDFVRSFAGVSKARVRVLRSGGEELIHVTLATEDGRPLDPGSGLYRSLVQAIEEYRVPGPPVRVDSYEPVYFDLAAAVLVEVDRVADAVVAAVVETLTEAFSFARRDLGAGLTASDVVALIQGISGVTAVRLEALYPIGWRREVNPVLTAEPARWERGQVVPDQLLLLNASNGLQIRAEKGR